LKKQLSEKELKQLEKLWSRMIDWLLFNLEEIKSYIKEMQYLGSGVVSGCGAPSEEDSSLELNVIAVNEAAIVISSIEKVIKQFEPEDFDIFIDRYHSQMIYSKIAEWEDIAEITVKRHIVKIREAIKEGLENNDVELEIIVKLRDKLRYIITEKVA
jgi:hypothetical protein